MTCDLIIDGNYLLNRMVFTLHKNNLLFGALLQSLENSITNYKNMYPFSKVFLVSDSRDKSWRKKINSDYKSNRVKNSDIDWDFVFNTYNEFKENLKEKRVKVLEAPGIEGDDWIMFLIKKSNEEGCSTLTITNDYDIKQLIGFSLEPLYINFISNEMYNNLKVFLPKNYKIFLNELSKRPSTIFDMNDNTLFYEMLSKLTLKNETSEVDPVESLMVKLISGDSSDNISSVWSVVKNGRKRGIAEKGAKSIFDDYISAFGEPDINDPDLSENIADLICEKKKLGKTSMQPIKDNVDKNIKLIYLSVNNYPEEIVKSMEQTYNII